METSIRKLNNRRKHWRHLLNPKVSDISFLLPIIDDVYDLTLIYKGKHRGEYIDELFLNKYPDSVDIQCNKINIFDGKTNHKDIKNEIEKLWDSKDELLENNCDYKNNYYNEDIK